MISLRVNAQEAPVDIQEPVAIETTLEVQPDKIELPAPSGSGTETPVVEAPTAGVVVDTPINTTYDDIRLQIMSAQALSYESTGEYTQIAKDATVLNGDSITFEAVKDELFTGKEEVHVYEGPCGRGWQLIIHDVETGFIYATSTDSMVRGQYPVVRSYGYGCEHDSRTVNW